MDLKISRRFIINTGAMLFSLLGLTVVTVLASGSFDGPLVAAATAISLLLTSLLLWSVHKYQHTRISDTGVEQPAISGLLRVQWRDVSGVSLYRGAFILDCPGGKLMIYPRAYEQPEQVSDYVVARLKRVFEDRQPDAPDSSPG